MRHCLVPWFIRHCWLSSSLAYGHCHTLLPFACADDQCLSLARGSDPRLWILLRTSFFWPGFVPRGQRARLDSGMCVRIDRSTCLVEPSCSKVWHSCFPHVWHHFLGCLSRLFFVNLGSLSALLSALRLCPSCSWGKDWHWSAPPRASDPSLCLILDHWNLSPHAPGDHLRLILDHRNLSPHSPGDLGNHIDVLHLRNLHDFLQSGCSEHFRLHLRIFRAFVWLLDLFLLHHWDTHYSFSELPQFSVPLLSLAPSGTKIGRNLHINELVVLLFLCTFDGFLHRPHWPLHVHGDVDNFSVNCSLITLHVFSGRTLFYVCYFDSPTSWWSRDSVN